MTTEEDFQKQLDDHPDDWQTRLVFADWLEEHSDPRAEGYRALGILRVRPVDGNAYDDSGEFWWSNMPYDARWRPFALPGHWFNKTVQWTAGALFQKYHTRREAEDAAALAFAKMPPDYRANLLAAADVPNSPTVG